MTLRLPAGPNAARAQVAPVMAGLSDRHPYVRRTAVMGVLKIWHMSPDTVTNTGAPRVLVPVHVRMRMRVPGALQPPPAQLAGPLLRVQLQEINPLDADHGRLLIVQTPIVVQLLRHGGAGAGAVDSGSGPPGRRKLPAGRARTPPAPRPARGEAHASAYASMRAAAVQT